MMRSDYTFPNLAVHFTNIRQHCGRIDCGSEISLRQDRGQGSGSRNLITNRQPVVVLYW